MFLQINTPTNFQHTAWKGYATKMKITAIETLVCHARMRNWVFVKVVTDQPGAGRGVVQELY